MSDVAVLAIIEICVSLGVLIAVVYGFAVFRRVKQFWLRGLIVGSISLAFFSVEILASAPSCISHQAERCIVLLFGPGYALAYGLPITLVGAFVGWLIGKKKTNETQENQPPVV